jgi:hypothetical protein
MFCLIANIATIILRGYKNKIIMNSSDLPAVKYNTNMTIT